MSTLFKVRVLVFSFINVGIVWAPNTLGAQVLDETKIEVRATIIGESCTAIAEEGQDMSIDFGDISLSDVKKQDMIDLFPKGKQGGVDFSCPKGTWANFKFYVASPNCSAVAENGVTVHCGGPNKTVGIYTRSEWRDKDDNFVGLWSYDSNPTATQTVKLVDGKGTISAVKFARLRRLKGIEPTPGEVKADLVLQVWSE